MILRKAIIFAGTKEGGEIASIWRRNVSVTSASRPNTGAGRAPHKEHHCPRGRLTMKR